MYKTTSLSRKIMLLGRPLKRLYKHPLWKTKLRKQRFLAQSSCDYPENKDIEVMTQRIMNL